MRGELTTSPRRKPGSPIKSVTLKITFEGNRKELSEIRKAIPSVIVRGGACEVTIRAESPAGVTERAKEILEKLRGA